MRRKLVVVSHSHWDREWYLTFQHTRLRLVRLMDQLLDILSTDPGYRHFMCDGQTVMLEDYVEVRPERRLEIARLIQEGSLVIGPWYVLADEFIPDGESLIRNLILGERQMTDWGAAPHGIGYLPDAFGHIAQMPQILRGFGLDAAVLWRGVPEEVGKSEFVWQGADGSDLFSIHLPNGYANAQELPFQEESLLRRLSLIRRQLEGRATTEHLLLMNGNDHAEPQAELSRIIALANERLEDAEVVHGTLPMYVAGVRASLEGDGHLLPKVQGELRSVRGAHLLQGVLSTRMWVKQQNRACETLLIRWAEPFTAIAALLVERGELQESRVESRESRGRGGVSTLAPRLSTLPLIWLAWKYLLQNQAHDSICGCSVDEVYEDVRARFNWCSQIGEELVQQALRTIAASVNTGGLPETTNPEGSPVGEGSRSAFVVFNAEAGPRTDFVTLRTNPSVGKAADAADVILADDEGSPVPYQVLAQHCSELLSTDVSRADLEGFLNLVSGGDMTVWSKEKIDALESLLALTVADKFPQLVITGVDIRPSPVAGTVIIEIDTAERGAHNYQAIADSLRAVTALVTRGDADYFQLRISRRDELEIGFVAADVPGYGYRTFQMVESRAESRESSSLGGVSTLNSRLSTLENEYFIVQASLADGSLAVIDRETGAMYERLNLFVDGGDAGDEYNYCPPEKDRLVVLPAAPPEIRLVENGPARWTLRIDTVLILPRSLADGRLQRSEEGVACPISSFVSLYPGVRRIDVRTEVDNRAEDHRLRVHFPTKVVASHSAANHSFTVVERPVLPAEGPPLGEGNGFEQALGTYPHHTFVDVRDSASGRGMGLLLASRGLPEYEAISASGGTILALTLLRSVGWLSRDDLKTRQGNAGPSLPTPGAQCPGRHEFHYALVPHNGGRLDVAQQAYWFASPLRAVESAAPAGQLPLRLSFVELEPATLRLTALKAAEKGDGIIVRFFNPGVSEQLARISVHWPVRTVEIVNLGERKVGAIEDGTAGQWRVPVGPQEIVTLKFVT